MQPALVVDRLLRLVLHVEVTHEHVTSAHTNLTIVRTNRDTQTAKLTDLLYCFYYHLFVDASRL